MAPLGSMFVPVAVDPISQLLSKLFEFLWRLAAGFVNGVRLVTSRIWYLMRLHLARFPCWRLASNTQRPEYNRQ
jgi:hypothetical protein